MFLKIIVHPLPQTLQLYRLFRSTCCKTAKASSNVKVSGEITKPRWRKRESNSLKGGGASFHSRNRSPWAKTVRGVPSITSHPSYITKSRSANEATSVISCETSTIVTLCSCLIRLRYE